MRILIVIGGFFPGRKYGGPPVSVNNFCSLMMDVAECYIVTHNHDMDEQKPYEGIKEGWTDRGNVKVLYLSDKEYRLATFERIIIDIHPDYIYLQSLFQQCVPPCLWLAKKHGIKVVLATRGELCKGAFRKKYKKLPYISTLKILGLLNDVIFQSTSDEESAAIHKYLGSNQERIHLLTNIPSIPHNLSEREKKNPGKGAFVFISRILWKKNLLNAIRFLGDVKGIVQFDVYGPIEDNAYWDDCQLAIKELPPNITVKYCGILSYEEIHRTFNQYDAFLFPTLSENFGHVIAESMVTGCIPIISDQTPWTDLNEAKAGWAIPLSETNQFKEAIQEVVDMDESTIVSKRKAIAVYLSSKIKMEELRKDYMRVFK